MSTSFEMIEADSEGEAIFEAGQRIHVACDRTDSVSQDRYSLHLSGGLDHRKDLAISEGLAPREVHVLYAEFRSFTEERPYFL